MHNDTFADTITRIYGLKGTRWLAQLPELIEQCAQEWSLTKLQPYPLLTYNYVASGLMNSHIPIVLKLRCDSDELNKEIAALSTYAGDGCVKIIMYNQASGALLLEQIVPGDPLSSLFPHDDKKATDIAIQLVQKLHRTSIPTNKSFPLLENVLPDFTKEPPSLIPFISHARKLKQQLLSSSSNHVLLHGDFHHDNILLGPHNNWVVIDPEGIIGNPIYDIALFIRNPLKQLIHESTASTIILNRIHDFAAHLGYSPQEIYNWTYLQTITSAYWSVEDGLDTTNHCMFLSMLELLQKFI